MAVAEGCDFPGKVLLLSDVSVLCSYFRHPMSVAVSCAFFTIPAVFELLCRF